MSNLPEEIVVEILSRLPVKSLLRFRCVSNPWRNLISSANFAKLHLKRTSEHNADIDHHTILIARAFRTMKSMNYDPSESYHFNDLKLECQQATEYYIRIWGSCNGLIFLRVSFKDIAIWNPSTRDCKVLPKPGVSPNQFEFFGFGFDASIDDYKVVLGSYYYLDSNDRRIKVEVFTLKTNTWRRVQDICNLRVMSKTGTLANGVLHWLEEDGTIMSFDLAQEQFGEFVSIDSIPFAAQNSIDVEYMKLGVLRGCLCLFVPEVDSKNDEVWVMKEYGVNSSWSKLFSIFPHFVYVKPLCILKSGVLLLDVDGRQLQSYSPKDNRLKPICDSWVCLEAVVYVESLVSLN